VRAIQFTIVSSMASNALGPACCGAGASTSSPSGPVM
jgi:hypothetical protein